MTAPTTIRTYRFRCTECEVEYDNADDAARCHWGIGGVEEVREPLLSAPVSRVRIEPAPGNGNYRFICSLCGESVTYWGRSFVEVEARRHDRWHQEQSRKAAPA